VYLARTTPLPCDVDEFFGVIRIQLVRSEMTRNNDIQKVLSFLATAAFGRMMQLKSSTEVL